ncbi:MAG: glycosyltransferase family 39 protein [Acidobacteria bacterium]|nr:glycosyltransferase family 39 protein [Acidobacteriota bacterium]
MQKTSLRLSSPIVHILILVSVSLPYCIRIGSSSIWNASEAFYAETSREMMVSEDYLAPYFNFEPRTQKPPLTYWAILASYKLFGVNEFSVRLPGCIAAISIILFSYAIALSLFNPRVALIAAVVTATTARVLILARRLPIDTLLMFFLMGTFFFLIRAIQTKNRGYWALSYLFAGAGFLTKGPVAVLVPAGVYLAWSLWNRKFNISEIRPILGLSILAAVVLPWYILIYREYGWTYIGTFFLKDNLGRYLSDSFGPARGPLYYFSVFVSDFFPWSFPAAAALFLLWRNRRQWLPFKSLSFGLPLIWCLLIFLMFSVSKNKQEYYIAPMYPVVAVILAAVLDKSLTGIAANFRIKIPASNSGNTKRSSVTVWKRLYLLLCILLLAFSILVFFILHSFMPHIAPVLHYVPSLVIAGAAILAIICVFKRRISYCFPAIATSIWIVFMMGVIFYFPALEAFRPVKSFCKKIEAHATADSQVGYYGVTVPSMVFYLKKQIFREYDPASMLRRFQSDSPLFCIITAKDHAFFSENSGLDLPVLDRGPRFSIKMRTILNGGYAPEEELLLVSNRPVASRAPEMPVQNNEN